MSILIVRKPHAIAEIKRILLLLFRATVYTQLAIEMTYKIFILSVYTITYFPFLCPFKTHPLTILQVTESEVTFQDATVKTVRSTQNIGDVHKNMQRQK